MSEEKSNIGCAAPGTVMECGTILDYLLKGVTQIADFDDQRMEIPEIARVVVTPTEVEIYTFDDFVYLIPRTDQKLKKMQFKDGILVEEGSVEVKNDSNTATQQYSMVD